MLETEIVLIKHPLYYVLILTGVQLIFSTTTSIQNKTRDLENVTNTKILSLMPETRHNIIF